MKILIFPCRCHKAYFGELCSKTTFKSFREFLFLQETRKLCNVVQTKVGASLLRGGVTSNVGCTGRLSPKGVPFLSSQYTKGWENC